MPLCESGRPLVIRGGWRLELILLVVLAGLLIYGATYCINYVIFDIVGELGEHFRGECGCYRDRNGVCLVWRRESLHGVRKSVGLCEVLVSL